MRPSSFITLFVLITAIFAAPLNLTFGIDGESDISILSEDLSMPLRRRASPEQRREWSKASIYWAVQELEAKHGTIEHNRPYYLKEFRGTQATLTKITTPTYMESRTISMMLSNLATTGQLIKYAIVKHMVLSPSPGVCIGYYVATKFMGDPSKTLEKKISEPLPNLREKARREYQDKFQLIFPSDNDDDYVYRSRLTWQGNDELEAKIVGVNWAFAKPVHHPDPGEPEIFK